MVLDQGNGEIAATNPAIVLLGLLGTTVSIPLMRMEDPAVKVGLATLLTITPYKRL